MNKMIIFAIVFLLFFKSAFIIYTVLIFIFFLVIVSPVSLANIHRTLIVSVVVLFVSAAFQYNFCFVAIPDDVSLPLWRQQHGFP